MRIEVLVACQPCPLRVTTETDALTATNIPDLLKRDVIANRPGVEFVGDITHIHTWQGFIYLATVIDYLLEESRRLAHRRSNVHRTDRERSQECRSNDPDHA